MKYSELGSSGVDASRVALGVMRLDGKGRDEAQNIVRTALDGGVNFFDTADCYSDGESSRRLGQALQDLKVDRQSIFVQTKFGIYKGDNGAITRYNFSKDHLIASLDRELENLQTDYVDFVLLHRPDTLVEFDELAEAFNELQNSGRVRHFGVSNMNPMQVEMLQSAVGQKLEVNQLQFGLGHTGMVQQEIHVNMADAASVDHDGGLISYSRLKGMTIQAWSPFQFGFFEGVFIDNPKFPALNEAMQRVADKYGVTKNAIAVAWILRHPARMQVLLGSMTPSRLKEMMAGADVEISAQEWYDLYVAAGNDLP
ncbi:Predicted oxidoreductase [Bifidobacterium bohemicum]|uniref:Aldo/keto reductase family oxidoreductase n=1 Tax=Bifidobacterium bohemicum DSM 22767 TaxID=1437606 RepID=A0A086ZF64_9BIFI|nr:aldo/keto reductase [Bifidobacterium bohemicum]KFI45164.1 aldo/keto reductase family oxidoreductase [Bifidobacterium bohemicum DSM 22767]SCB90028.1 Predicted oxidoreductase [Bifidobacterium bohemicum]